MSRANQETNNRVFPDSFIGYNELEEDLSIKTPDVCYHYTLSAFYQRHQWNQIWQIIKSTKTL